MVSRIRLTTWESRFFGFLLGSTVAGGSVYYYILEEYKISNEMLTEDIYVSTTKTIFPRSPFGSASC